MALLIFDAQNRAKVGNMVQKGVQKWVKRGVKNRILGPRGLKISEIWTFWSKNTLFLAKKSENFKR